jgi:hypothetical protein
VNLRNSDRRCAIRRSGLIGFRRQPGSHFQLFAISLLKRSLEFKYLQLDLLEFLQSVHLASVDAISQVNRRTHKK